MDIIIILIPIGAIIAVAIYFNYKTEQLKNNLTERYKELRKTQLKLLETVERIFPEPTQYVPLKEEYEKALDDSDIDLIQEDKE